MARLTIGVYKSLIGINRKWRLNMRFTPKIKNKTRKKLLRGWLQAIRKALIY